MDSPTPIARQGLGRRQRLKSRKRIQSLFGEGSSHSNGPVRVVFRSHSDGDPLLQAGFTAAVRNFPKAVDRNRVKRLLREAWRRHKSPLEESLRSHPRSMDVFLIYTGREIPIYTDVAERVKGVVARLTKQISDGRI